MNAIAGLAVLSVLVAVPAFAQDVGGPPPDAAAYEDATEWHLRRPAI